MAPIIGISCGVFEGEAQGPGGYDFDRLSRFYSQGLLNQGASPVLLPAFEAQALATAYAARLDGLLLSGGADLDSRLYHAAPDPQTHVQPLRDQSELALFAAFWQARKPIFAICRGLQLINVALGGTLIQDTSFVPSALRHRAEDGRPVVFHELEFLPGGMLRRLAQAERAQVNSFHHQHVGRVAQGLFVGARSPDGLIEGLEWTGDARWLLGVQWHPERALQEPLSAALFAAFVTECGRAPAAA